MPSLGLFNRWTARAGVTIGSGIARRFGENDGVLHCTYAITGPLTKFLANRP
ncbi:hypothetical protein [Raineyella sp. W15-4]|uniref:hypothetical protein n=1 Tax=Raineyella sp. W15-4 TaxID=3081651 RepID=UPI002952D769|nr:hypothetical protein [Raineyella sp. W15-4]WOQ17820.1 hypothetical protein R0145_03685 [Raineyella sp. W15-4]